MIMLFDVSLQRKNIWKKLIF